MGEMTRENAREIWIGGTIDQCAEELLKYKAKGESVVLNFNGHKIYSCEITSIDDAYQEVFGMNKVDTEKKWEEDRKRYLKEREERIAKAIAKTKADMPKYAEALRGIKSTELDERGFYEQVLKTITTMEGAHFDKETAQEMKAVLEEIGCLKYDDWKAVKEASGERVEEGNIGQGIEKADIGTAVSFVSQLMYDDPETATYGVSRMLDGGEEYGWVQQWIKNSQEKSQFKTNIPYYQVAKQALMNWNGLSEEEAKKIISQQSFDSIDSQVYAKGSMDYAIQAIANSFATRNAEINKREEEFSRVAINGNPDSVSRLNTDIDELMAGLSEYVYNGGQSEIAEDMKRAAETMSDPRAYSYDKRAIKEQYNNMIMDTLFAVHDGWVKDNVKKFNAREKKHQHMPSELIGWKEAKADLLFVRPIFESAGIEVNEEELEQVYNGRVKEFFLNYGIKSARNLSDSITQGEEFYPALEGYGEILTTINDPDYVDEKIIPAIEQQGIGNIEEIRKNIVSQIISNPVPEDVARLSDEEKAKVEQSLGQEVSTLTAQRDELHQKNSIVQGIMALANRRRTIKKEISIEEQRKSENIHEFDD